MPATPEIIVVDSMTPIMVLIFPSIAKRKITNKQDKVKHGVVAGAYSRKTILKPVWATELDHISKNPKTLG